ncbi:MAG: hypothetical protein JW776_14730 [Candidatus Lokiarchaeota archaeon]|nr:hypothetical protein [Candidatus Lokiarchaeota archaeon]
MNETQEEVQRQTPSFFGLFLCALFGFIGIIIGLIRLAKGRKNSGNRIIILSAIGFAIVVAFGSASVIVPYLGLVALLPLIGVVNHFYKKIKDGTYPWD